MKTTRRGGFLYVITGDSAMVGYSELEIRCGIHRVFLRQVSVSRCAPIGRSSSDMPRLLA
ncbi:MAG: hypothetical protein VW983_11275 [Halieaceae bacterium]